jgi:tRNA 5-methylaminomethyl-2-thiouridine biosynthesis bifunctional protein
MQVVDWGGDGQPRSALYPDLYRSHGSDGDHGLAQARHVFLGGCELLGEHALWRHRPYWCILENGFGLGLNFLATWQAWRQDPSRASRLHYVATEAHPVQVGDVLRSTQAWPELHHLTRSLADQWWGLLPGVHRLVFEGGAVQLDLVVGDSTLALPQLNLRADSVYLDGFSPRVNPAMWSVKVLRELTRLSRPGALWATWCVAGSVTRTLTELGLKVAKRAGLPPKREALQAHWPGLGMTPKAVGSAPVWVLGAGLAGASVARALAERGRKVRVLDALGSAAGASGLPAGLAACHTSTEDLALSRLTRMGLRHTLSRLQALPIGHSWAPSGLDELHLPPKSKRVLPNHTALSRDWYTQAPELDAMKHDWWQVQAGGWHQPRACWLKPAELVRHLLAHPDIEFTPNTDLHAVQYAPTGWRLLGAPGLLQVGIQDLVLAMGPGTVPILDALGCRLPMQAVRGQLSLGPVPPNRPAHWPARPRNGDGSLLPEVPLNGLAYWMVGSSFDRQRHEPVVLPQDHELNAQRWQRLAQGVDALGSPSNWQAWAGVRATVHDRLPWVGSIAHSQGKGLWVLAGLGARGLTLACLAGDHLAARITETADPLPISLKNAWCAQRDV